MLKVLAAHLMKQKIVTRIQNVQSVVTPKKKKERKIESCFGCVFAQFLCSWVIFILVQDVTFSKIVGMYVKQNIFLK